MVENAIPQQIVTVIHSTKFATYALYNEAGEHVETVGCSDRARQTAISLEVSGAAWAYSWQPPHDVFRRKAGGFVVGMDGAAGGDGALFRAMQHSITLSALCEAIYTVEQRGSTYVRSKLFSDLVTECGGFTAAERVYREYCAGLGAGGADGSAGDDGDFLAMPVTVRLSELALGDVFLMRGTEHKLVYRGAFGVWALRDGELVQLPATSDTEVIWRRYEQVGTLYDDVFFAQGRDGAAGDKGAEMPANASSSPASATTGAAATKLAQDAETAFNPFSVAVEALEYGDVVEVVHDGKAYKYFALGMVGGYALALENLHDTETVLLEGRATFLYRSNKVSPIFPAGLIEWRNREPQHAAKYKYSFDERPASYEYSEAWERWYEEGACWRSDARWQRVNEAIFAPREQGRF